MSLAKIFRFSPGGVSLWLWVSVHATSTLQGETNAHAVQRKYVARHSHLILLFGGRMIYFVKCPVQGVSSCLILRSRSTMYIPRLYRPLGVSMRSHIKPADQVTWCRLESDISCVVQGVLSFSDTQGPLYIVDTRVTFGRSVHFS